MKRKGGKKISTGEQEKGRNDHTTPRKKKHSGTAFFTHAFVTKEKTVTTKLGTPKNDDKQ